MRSSLRRNIYLIIILLVTKRALDIVNKASPFSNYLIMRRSKELIHIQHVDAHSLYKLEKIVSVLALSDK
jgi:hypothetical protein